MADFIGNLIMILIFTLSDFFERLEYLKHTETIIYKKKSIDFKPLYLILRLTFGLLREATVML